MPREVSKFVSPICVALVPKQAKGVAGIDKRVPLCSVLVRKEEKGVADVNSRVHFVLHLCLNRHTVVQT